MLEVCIGALSYGRRDLAHFLVAFRVGHDFALLQFGECEGDDGAHEPDPEQALDLHFSPLLFVLYSA